MNVWHWLRYNFLTDSIICITPFYYNLFSTPQPNPYFNFGKICDLQR